MLRDANHTKVAFSKYLRRGNKAKGSVRWSGAEQTRIVRRGSFRKALFKGPRKQIIHKIDKDFSRTFHCFVINGRYTEVVPKNTEQNLNLLQKVRGEAGIPDHEPAG
jgi:hypothetical protein